MGTDKQMLALVEARYQIALRRLGFRLLLIVSIAGIAQGLSNLLGGGG